MDLWILREKADCKQSTSVFVGFSFGDKFVLLIIADG